MLWFPFVPIGLTMMGIGCDSWEKEVLWESDTSQQQAIAACRAAFDPRQGHGFSILNTISVTGWAASERVPPPSSLQEQLEAMCPTESTSTPSPTNVLTAGAALCLAAAYGLPPGLDGYSQEFYCRKADSAPWGHAFEMQWYVQTFTQTDCPFPPSSRGQGFLIDARSGELLSDNIGFTQFHTCPREMPE